MPITSKSFPLSNANRIAQMAAFANEVKRLVELESQVRKALPDECAKLMSAYIDRCGGVRLAARKLGLSPTYVCRLGKGTKVVSPARFLELSKALDLAL